MPRKPRSAVALVIVVVLHLALFALLQWQLQRRPRAADAPEPAPLVVRLLWPQPPATPRPPTAQVPSPAQAARQVTQALPAAREPQPISAPAAITVPAQPAGAQAAAPVDTPAVRAQAPLNLALPAEAASAPPSVRSQALNDPRTSSHQTYSERFAATLGTDQTAYEDPLPNGGRRFRKGTSCYEAYESLSSQVDPFGGPKPNVMRSCKKQ